MLTVAGTRLTFSRCVLEAWADEQSWTLVSEGGCGTTMIADLVPVYLTRGST